MAITTASSSLGTSAFSNFAPIELLPKATLGDIETVILAVYQQVLGNQHTS